MHDEARYGTMEPEGEPSSWDRSYGEEPAAESLLGNPLRAEMVALLRERPGTNKLRLAKAMGTEIKHIDFHLQRLVKAGLVDVRRGRGPETLCFMKEDVHLWDNEASRVFFGRGSSLNVAAFLSDRPGLSAPEIAEGLGISVYSARRHIRILQECELVRRSRVDQSIVYHAAPSLIDWIEQIGDRWVLEED